MAIVKYKLDIKDAAYVAANPTKVLEADEPIWLNDGTYAFGDGVTALSALTFFGGASGIDVGTSPVLNATNGYILYNNNGTLGEIQTSGTGAVLLASSISNMLETTDIGVTVQGYSANTTLLGNSITGSGSIVLATSPSLVTPNIGVATATRIITPEWRADFGGSTRVDFSAATSAPAFKLTNLNKSSLTASTERIQFDIVNANANTLTWATGNITTQRYAVFGSPTYAFDSPSTITNAYTLYVNAPTAGTNATITNNYAAGFGGNINVTGSYYVGGVAGASGTFTTTDAKTVTVTNGIITSIV